MTGQADPIAPIILGVTGILFFAILGRHVAHQLNQPSVLGELVIGILIGTVGSYLGLEIILILREGPTVFDIITLQLGGETLESAALATLDETSARRLLAVLQGPNGGVLIQVAHTLEVFSRYGVIFLLFLVGLESSVEAMEDVGAASGRVAVIGILLPFLLGFGTIRLLQPELSLTTDMFVAATLGATSIGITARVLTDLDLERSRDGRIIVGAAVLDDVLGLVMLAVVSGIVLSGGIEPWNILKVAALALAFLVGAVKLGPYVLRLTVRILSRLHVVEVKMFTSFMFAMVLAWMANLVGLATIVGAFTAGLLLSEEYFRDLPRAEDSATIKGLIMPLEVILVPIFFILMGIQVKLETFLDPRVLFTAAGLIVVAMVGKILSGWGAGERGTNRWLIGFGMMPRGEVGLIFASIGKGLGVISDALFSSVVLMVVVTTLAAPPLIERAARWSAPTAPQQ